MDLTLLLSVLALASSQDHRLDGAHTPPPERDDPASAYWERVAEDLNARRSVRQVLTLDPAGARAREAVRTTSLASLEIDQQQSLSEAAQAIQLMSGLPILVEGSAKQRALDEGLVFDLRLTHPASVETVLDIFCDRSDGALDWTVREGSVILTVPERALEPTVFMHPVADLTAAFDPEEVSIMIQEHVSPASWDQGGVATDVTGAFVTAVHEREVQLEIEAFIQDLRRFRATLDGPPAFGQSSSLPELDAAYARLESTQLAASFEQAPIAEVAAFLQESSGFNVVVSRKVAEEGASISLSLPRTDVRTLLDLIVQVEPELSWSVSDGVVHIKAATEARPDHVLAFYDIGTIVGPAPPECVFPSASGRGDEVHENLVISPDALVELCSFSIDPESWDNDPRNSMRINGRSILVVNQSYANQLAIRDLLTNLQAIADVMLAARDS